MLRLSEDYSLVLYQDVLWGDMDAYGHVNNAVYFRYFEDVRMAYFVETGIMRIKEETGVGPILATTTSDFKFPLTYPDKLQIACKAEVTGPKKVLFEYAIYSEGHDKLAATGSSLVVFFDYGRHSSTEVPSEIVAAISDLNHS